jgi:hypothetical protein
MDPAETREDLTEEAPGLVADPEFFERVRLFFQSCLLDAADRIDA